MILSAPPPLSASAALFLDFDGTLAPLAPRPQDVSVPAWVRPALAALAVRLGGALAIVSGRPIEQIDAFLAPLRLPVAGAHGAQWRVASGEIQHLSATPPLSVLASARELAMRHEGLILEPKPSGFALHFRARPELEALCRDTLASALAEEPAAGETWEWLHGHFVHELKQRSVSKGGAVRALLGGAPFAGRQPVFVGDDVTDEDGIAAVQAAGGYGVRVGSTETRALYHLADVQAVGTWLEAALRAAGGITDTEKA